MGFDVSKVAAMEEMYIIYQPIGNYLGIQSLGEI
jgi:hypothetical protein